MTGLCLPRTLFLSALLLIVAPVPLLAQTGAGDPLQEVLRRVRLMEERVKKIEASEQEILKRQEKILAELENLRVWVARR